MLMLIADWASRKNLKVRITGIDANPNIITYARKNTADYPNIDYLTMDIFNPEFSELTCDIFTATLFMHHLSDEQLVDILLKMKTQARIGIVINDLHRHWFAYHSIKLITRVFSKSEMVRNDAAVSVRRSFLKFELSNLLLSANLLNYDIRWFWAFRWQLVIRTSRPPS